MWRLLGAFGRHPYLGFLAMWIGSLALCWAVAGSGIDQWATGNRTTDRATSAGIATVAFAAMAIWHAARRRR